MASSDQASEESCASQTGLSPGKLDNYLSTRGAQAYLADHQDKLHRRLSDRRELKIYRQFFAEIGAVDSVLDTPCGYGRLVSFLGEHASRIYQSDLSPSMLALNAETNAATVAGLLRASTLALPLRDDSFDMLISIRLNHHLSTIADREKHLRELFRVARKHVIMSYFSSRSLKAISRRLRAKVSSKREKNSMPPNRVAAIAAECGYRVARQVPLSRLASGHMMTLCTAV